MLEHCLAMNRAATLLAGVVILAALAVAIGSVWNESMVVDEVPHIGAGYSYLVKRDMRLNPEHPPLAKDVAAIPLLFLNLDRSAFETEYWKVHDFNAQWNFGRHLSFDSGNDPERITHLAKLPMLLFFLGSALLLFHWGRKLYGERAALLSLILFCFSPTVIAHARFVATDVPALCGVLCATYCILRYLKRPDTPNLLLSGCALGFALVTKFSTLLLFPYFVLLSLGWKWTRAPSVSYGRIAGSLVLIFAIAGGLVVYPVYAFHTAQYPPERQRLDIELFLQEYPHRTIASTVVWASTHALLRPAAQFVLGVCMVAQRSSEPNLTYFLGEVSRTGSLSYFPIVYLLKEPLAWWALVSIALALLASQWNAGKVPVRNFISGHFDEFAMLLWLAIYWLTSITSNINIGVRHLLPVYPFSILLVSGQVFRFIRRSRLRLALVTFILGWYMAESAHTYPYYLTYFNELAGGPSGGYRYVVDSNVDWGQDLIRLSDWVRKHDIAKIETDYFGWADVEYYLGERFEPMQPTKYSDADDFRERNQTDGWLAVSANFLQGSQGPPDDPAPVSYLWLKAYDPVTVIGNSIFVYRIPPNR